MTTTSAHDGDLALDTRRASLIYRLLKPHTDALALSEGGLVAESARLPEGSAQRRLLENRLAIVRDDQAIAHALIKDLEWLHPWLKKRGIVFATGMGAVEAKPLQSEIDAWKRQNEALRGSTPTVVNGHLIFLDELHLRWVISDTKTGLVRLHYSQAAALALALAHKAGTRDGSWGQLLVPTTSIDDQDAQQNHPELQLHPPQGDTHQ